MIRDYNKKKQKVLSERLKKRVAKAKKVCYSIDNNMLDLLLTTLTKDTHYEQS
jgi:hypothetical protein